MSEFEVQVAELESANRLLKEQVAQMTRDACRSSLSKAFSKACAFCKELDVTPHMATVIPPHHVLPPNEPTPKLWTEPFLSSLAPRTAAKRSAACSFKQEADAHLACATNTRKVVTHTGAASTAMDVDSAAGSSSAISSQSFPGSQRLVPQSRKEACTATRNVVAASVMARTVVAESVEEPW